MQEVHHKGLCHNIDSTQFVSVHKELLFIFSCNDKYRDMIDYAAAVHVPKNIYTAHSRHYQIKEHSCDILAAVDMLERFNAVGSFDYIIVLKSFRQKHSVELHIINDQYFFVHFKPPYNIFKNGRRKRRI